MKLLMLVGGFVGFLIGLAFAWQTEGQWPAILWRASLAAYLAGWLMRWWGKTWVRCLEQVQAQRLAEAQPESAPAAHTP
ncbi:MAG: hypothetical protein FJ387_09605 [Verrucomicrobia bacterium]|nr:hypothetical protein [Verrucomicrobiota bacterium]